MFARLLVLLFVISAASAASLHPANIPVRILYEEPRAKNLLEEAPVLGHLDEKPQLSLEERREQVKHHPQEQLTPNQLLNQAQSYVDQFLDSNKPQGASVQDAFLEFTRNVNELLQEEKNKLDLKQENNNQNIIQTITNGIQSIAQNFQNNIQGGASGAANGSEDQQQAGGNGGGFQNFINNFQGGVQNLVNNIQNLGQQGQQLVNNNGTVQGDTGTGSPAPTGGNIFQNFVSGVQNLLNGNQPTQITQIGNLTQGDTGTNATAPAPSGGPNPVQLFQNIGSQVGNAFNQIVSGGQGAARPPSGSEDENSSSPAPPNGPIQIIQGIGNAFNQLISGGGTAVQQQNVNRPSNSSGDEGSTAAPAPANQQNLIQSIGNAFQGLNPFRPTDKPGSTNPIQQGISQAQNVGSQIQQVVQPAAVTENTKSEDIKVFD